MYTTYDYYANEYCACGNIVVDAADFRKLMLEVQSIIDVYTFGRCRNMSEIPIEIQNCCCELVELVSEYNDKLKKASGVSSEKNNNYSVTYISPEVYTSQFEADKAGIVYRWLSNTGLLYRGL